MWIFIEENLKILGFSTNIEKWVFEESAILERKTRKPSEQMAAVGLISLCPRHIQGNFFPIIRGKLSSLRATALKQLMYILNEQR